MEQKRKYSSIRSSTLRFSPPSWSLFPHSPVKSLTKVLIASVARELSVWGQATEDASIMQASPGSVHTTGGGCAQIYLALVNRMVCNCSQSRVFFLIGIKYNMMKLAKKEVLDQIKNCWREKYVMITYLVFSCHVQLLCASGFSVTKKAAV